MLIHLLHYFLLLIQHLLHLDVLIVVVKRALSPVEIIRRQFIRVLRRQICDRGLLLVEILLRVARALPHRALVLLLVKINRRAVLLRRPLVQKVILPLRILRLQIRGVSLQI